MIDFVHLFLDLPDSAPEARDFWVAATGWSLSESRGESGQFATLLPPEGDSWVKVQTVPGEGGVHLDLDSSDREESVRRSLALGATHAWTYADVVVHRSPGGFVFCHTLTSGSASGPPVEGAVLDQVCLDIPPRLWEAEVVFWSALLGRPAVPGERAEYAFLEADGQLRVLLQRLDSDGPRVTGHPDFAVADRPAETERHVGLGARFVDSFDRWTVLEAPGGQVSLPHRPRAARTCRRVAHAATHPWVE